MQKSKSYNSMSFDKDTLLFPQDMEHPITLESFLVPFLSIFPRGKYCSDFKYYISVLPSLLITLYIDKICMFSFVCGFFCSASLEIHQYGCRHQYFVHFIVEEYFME